MLTMLRGCMSRGIRSIILIILFLSASKAMALDVTMSVKFNKSQMTVSGMTNLPDGTELIVNICDTEEVYKSDGKITVSKGAFKAGPFTQPYNREFTLNIISQIAAYQPPKVRTVIGDGGENMTGKLVVKGSFGGLIASYHAKIVLSQDYSQRRKHKIAAPFNRYSSYCALKASGRKDLPPITETLILR